MAAKRKKGPAQEPIDFDDPRHSRNQGGASMAAKGNKGFSTTSSRQGDDHLLEGKGPLYQMTLQRETKLQINPIAVGQLWHGLIAGIRNPCEEDGKSLARQYPSTMRKHQGECYQGCGCDHQANKEWEKYSHQRGVGESMSDLKMAGNAFIFEEVTEAELLDFYRRAKAAAAACAVPQTNGAVSAQGWRSPLVKPSEVRHPYAEARGDHAHTGEDLRAAEGTEVVAPYDMQIVEIGSDERSGNYVIANVKRQGRMVNAGTFPRDVPAFDDSGWQVVFAHLKNVLPGVVIAENKGITGGGIQPTPGSIILQGQPFALSGHTGKRLDSVTGAMVPVDDHLHFGLKWFQDDPLWNSDEYVDPRMMVPDEVIKGTLTFAPPRTTPLVTQAIDQPRGAGGEQKQSGRSLIISGDNNVIGLGRDKVTVVGVGGGNALDVNLGLAPKLQVPTFIDATVVDEILKPRQLRDGGEGPLVVTERIPTDGAPPRQTLGPPSGMPEFLPSKLWQAEELQAVGGKIVDGFGIFAGKAFNFATSPEGIGAITGVAGDALTAAGGVAQVASPLLSTFGGALQVIPYAGVYLASAAKIIGPVLGPVGLALSAAGGIVKAIGGGRGVGNAQDPLASVFGSQLLPSDQAGPPTPFQSALSSVFPGRA